MKEVKKRRNSKNLVMGLQIKFQAMLKNQNYSKNKCKVFRMKKRSIRGNRARKEVKIKVISK